MSDNTVQDPNDILPFSEIRQRALLGHLITNERFFLQGYNKIQPEFFVDPFASKLLTAKLAFYNKYKLIPTIHELKDLFLIEDTPTRNKTHATINFAVQETKNFHLEALTPELTDWLKARLYLKHVDRSAKLYNTKQLTAAYAEIKAVNAQIDDISFEDDLEMKFDNYVAFLQQQEQFRQEALTFGLKRVDEILYPEGIGGGLLRGDTTVLLAPTNIGKTSAMITVLIHNLMRGKSVLFLTHEGRKEDIYEKIWCSTLGWTRAELYQSYSIKEGQEIMNKKLKWLTSYLSYIPYNKAGGTVEEVEALIRRKQQERIAKTGKGYDLLVCDYPAKLTTNQAQHGNLQYRHIELHIYNIFVQLALEYNFHALLAIQANREAAKRNRGRGRREDGHYLLTMEDVAESYGPMQVATNVISINRDEIAMARNRVTYYICKSRSNETGWAVVCRSNYAKCIIHSDKLGFSSYRSSASMPEKIDTLLEQYERQIIPMDKIAA